MSKLFSASLVSVLALASSSALAQEEKAPAPAVAATAAVHHAPPATATAHAPLKIAAVIDYPQTIKRALVVYYVGSNKTAKEVPFLRSADGYLAEIPEDDVVPGSLAYTIELESDGGKRTSAFATRSDPHVVDVPTDLDDQRENALDARLFGRRSVFGANSEYVSFGSSQLASGKTVADNYYRIEGSYTYRPLRTILEFGIRTGMVRGHAPIETPPGQVAQNPGLNYGGAFVVFRLHDIVHLETSLLTSVTEQGFSSGVGGALHFGDPYGTKLVLGFETVKTFGTRAYSRLDLVRGWIRVSPIVEVTDAPHADRAGVRLVTELGVAHPSGWSIAIRGGYAARDFNSGGPGFGGSLAYSF
ncbi:MAG: hypothetical protein ACXWUG_02450 [Polyangiales bacterium]